MRDLYTELINELDRIGEEVNPDEPETNTRNIPTEPEVVTKKTARRKEK